MGDPKAFLNIPRQEAGYRPVSERITDYSQVEQTLNTNSRKLFTRNCIWGYHIRNLSTKEMLRFPDLCSTKKEIYEE